MCFDVHRDKWRAAALRIIKGRPTAFATAGGGVCGSWDQRLASGEVNLLGCLQAVAGTHTIHVEVKLPLILRDREPTDINVGVLQDTSAVPWEGKDGSATNRRCLTVSVRCTERAPET